MNSDKVKHLEFIQANISRMNTCSFQIKSWSITLVSAFLAIYVSSMGDGNKGNILFIYLAIIPTSIFWILDSYYLQQERKFRGIYKDLTTENVEGQVNVRIIESFQMPLNEYKNGKYNFIKVMFSKTEYPLYLSIIILLLITGCILSGSLINYDILKLHIV